MRYRQLDANGDMVFGQGTASFFIDSSQAVAQAILTRLLLYRGEWFLNTQDGTPWNTKVLGVRTQGTRDVVLRARILGTPGVSKLNSFQGVVNPVTRAYTVTASVTTIYSSTVVSVGPVTL